MLHWCAGKNHGLSGQCIPHLQAISPKSQEIYIRDSHKRLTSIYVSISITNTLTLTRARARDIDIAIIPDSYVYSYSCFCS